MAGISLITSGGGHLSPSLHGDIFISVLWLWSCGSCPSQTWTLLTVNNDVCDVQVGQLGYWDKKGPDQLDSVIHFEVQNIYPRRGKLIRFLWPVTPELGAKYWKLGQSLDSSIIQSRILPGNLISDTNWLLLHWTGIKDSQYGGELHQHSLSMGWFSLCIYF